LCVGGERKTVLFLSILCAVPGRLIHLLFVSTRLPMDFTSRKKNEKKKKQCECNITTLSSYYYSNVQSHSTPGSNQQFDYR
jgi:hypothetical protein